MDKIIAGCAWVPSQWHLEVANRLTVAMRRKRVTAEFRIAALADLASLDIRVDPQTGGSTWTGTLGMADRFGNFLYDAAYLELAIRRNLPLATFDTKLAGAALQCGIALLGSV